MIFESTDTLSGSSISVCVLDVESIRYQKASSMLNLAMKSGNTLAFRVSEQEHKSIVEMHNQVRVSAHNAMVDGKFTTDMVDAIRESAMASAKEQTAAAFKEVAEEITKASIRVADLSAQVEKAQNNVGEAATKLSDMPGAMKTVCDSTLINMEDKLDKIVQPMNKLSEASEIFTKLSKNMETILEGGE